MFLTSLAHVPLAYPCTGLAWTADTPQSIKSQTADLLAQGLSHPAIFNDVVITKGLMDLGLPLEEACLYQQSTCVEITPCAASNVYVASPYINLPQLLQDVLGIPSRGTAQDDASVAINYPVSFDDLLTAYHNRLEQAIAAGVIEQNTLQMTRRYNGGKALLSCFVNDCLARGKDIDHGGARYNWIEPSFVGLANLVDSLHAIRRFVYQEGAVPLDGLAEILRNNYEGCENLRCQMEYRAEKYGNDLDVVDDLARTITDWVAESTAQYRTYLGGRYVSGFFCWIMHEQLGRRTAATADGRKAGFPLGDGSGPAQGRERLGPTAAILSTTKWNHSAHIGGIALNLKFTPPRQRAVFNARLVDLIEAYVQRGGFELQVNVVDGEKLEAARRHPQEYQDLVVRIGGYSDYFVRLSPEMQAEVILRTAHEAL
jgi:formate C-acetyltransferase